MPSEMIERVARAICWKNGMNPNLTLGRDGKNFLWHEYTSQACAAIEAMRIPTFEMLCEASNITISRPGNDETNSDYDLYPDECKYVWQTMIDEALKA